MLSTDDYTLLEKYLHDDKLLDNLIGKLHMQHTMQISMISHELRNPLTMVSSYLQLLQSQHPEIISYNYWSNLVSETDYMCQLLQELSLCNNVSKINPQVINLELLVRECGEQFSNNFCKNSYTVHFTCEKNIPMILGDPIRLREVFYNLLQNSHEAFNNVQCDVECIDIHIKKIDNLFLRISVKDNSSGIDDDIKEKIFLPFFTSKETGNGIGLPLCKNIVEAHKGNIFFESIANEGTTFFIDLPYIV